MFGDMQMSPFQYVKSSVQFDPSKWPLSNSATLSPQVNFTFAFHPSQWTLSNSATISDGRTLGQGAEWKLKFILRVKIIRVFVCHTLIYFRYT